MGGHGGLNILPQKKWNVYNFDNREKVRKDEEAAARDEQLKRDQSRKRDSEFRLLQLRRARGVVPHSEAAEPLKLKSESKSEPPVCADEPKSESDSKHINLFDGIKILDPIEVVRKVKKEDEEGSKRKKMKKEEARVVGPEDEVYRLGYGVAGKGVKAPWYTLKPDKKVEEKRKAKSETNDKMMKKTKKTVEELREERLKREKAEKERERALLLNKRPCNDHYPRLVYRMKKSSANHFIIQKADKKRVHNAVEMGTGKNLPLVTAEDLSIPSHQVIVMSANMGCSSCRDKVLRVLSKMTGFKEYTVDVRKKQVIIKGDVKFLWSANKEVT